MLERYVGCGRCESFFFSHAYSFLKQKGLRRYEAKDEPLKTLFWR
jgi:hypothetical protein